jgi:hypothetical protein
MRLASEYPAIRADRNNPYLLRFLFLLFGTFVLMRFMLNANVLDTVMKYTAEGGSIVEKIHPSSYGLALVLLTTLLAVRTELAQWELRVVRSFVEFVLFIGAISAFASAMGHRDSIGYLVDSYIVACIAGMLMLSFPPSWRESVGTILIAFTAISACVAIGEFALRQRLLPYPWMEVTFRPTGFTEHPLALGLFNSVAICFVPLTRWSLPAKIGVSVALLLGTFAAGARVASIIAAASALAVVILYSQPSMPRAKLFQMKSIFIIGAIIAVPLMLMLLVQMGLFDRFQHGLVDDNAMMRVNIYRLFDLVSWNDILFGTDISMMRRLALDYFEMETIESSIIMFIFQFGLFGAIIFLLFLARMFFVLLLGAGRYVVLGTGVFFAIAGSNNALSSKSPVIVMIVLYILAFHGRNRAVTGPQ